MSKSPNPYDPPIAEAKIAERSSDFGSVILIWERLRLIYNAALALLVMLVTVVFCPENLGSVRFWIVVIFCGCVANVCFLTGPAIEGYGRHFGLWHKAMTWVLFAAGLLFTALLAVEFVVTYQSMFNN